MFLISTFVLICIQLVSMFGQNHIPVSILSSGGNTSSGSKFMLNSTVGQFVIGNSQNQKNASDAGFWYVSDKIIPAAIGERNKGLSTELDVSQNYPNPFTLKTEFNISLPKPGMLIASVYNTKGVKVGEIINDYLDAGKYILEYTPKNLPKGIYYYRFRFDGNVVVRKMVLVR